MDFFSTRSTTVIYDYLDAQSLSGWPFLPLTLLHHTWTLPYRKFTAPHRKLWLQLGMFSAAGIPCMKSKLMTALYTLLVLCTEKLMVLPQWEPVMQGPNILYLVWAWLRRKFGWWNLYTFPPFNSLQPNDVIWWHRYWATLDQIMGSCQLASSY